MVSEAIFYSKTEKKNMHWTHGNGCFSCRLIQCILGSIVQGPTKHLYGEGYEAHIVIHTLYFDVMKQDIHIAEFFELCMKHIGFVKLL